VAGFAAATAAQCAGWDQAPPPAISAFATASARLFAEIARDDPQPWKQQLASAASQWMIYRQGAVPSKAEAGAEPVEGA